MRLIKFRYRDFYDIPRIIVFQDGKRTVLLDCEFDNEKDDYGEEYKIYEIELKDSDSLSGSWDNIKDGIKKNIGFINVKDVKFDETKRKFIDPVFLRIQTG